MCHPSGASGNLIQQGPKCLDDLSVDMTGFVNKQQTEPRITLGYMAIDMSNANPLLDVDVRRQIKIRALSKPVAEVNTVLAHDVVHDENILDPFRTIFECL
jgi:hypothetical protein